MNFHKQFKKSVTIPLLGVMPLLFTSCDSEDALVTKTSQESTVSIGETSETTNALDSQEEDSTSSTQADTMTKQTSATTAATDSLAKVPLQEKKSDDTVTNPSSIEPTPSIPNPESGNSSENLEWGTDASSPSGNWVKPAIGKIYNDPSYGTPVQRVSDSGSDRFNRNTYSRRQAENADGTMFLTYHGSATYHVYSVATNTLVDELPVHPNGEPQWHPTDPSTIRHISGANSYVGSLKFYETNVNTGETTTIADLTSRIKAKIPSALYMQDRAEGSPSSDGNRYAWMVYNNAEKPVGFVSYDLKSDTVLGLTSAIDPTPFDWVSMSPSGKYVVASETNGTYIFDADFSNKRLLTEAIEHSDIGYDQEGRETYVYIDFNSKSATAGWLTAVDLETGDRTKIFDIYDNANSSVHVSMKGYDKPGWALVSTYNCKVPGAWTCDKIFAVEIAPNGRILNLAHTYNCGDNYWTETHAVVNRSFTRVYYNSDGGSCGIDAEVYRLDVPSFD